ncbi:MAG: cysteine desulfurase [Thaumarchaeota archaeon]|nr:MAG: cysteine desulfurase [Nitrososphaerota archaeon]TLX81486.1 MAG: cysteine desulfurase [Nitrososphaerota archaeon]
MIYLDNAASTPVHEKVIEEMIPYFKEQYGNPSSIHKYGRLASTAIQTARKRIASLINAENNEILITSGGTESNNTALYGITHHNKGKHIITSAIEHDAILEPCKRLEEEGFQITYLPVDKYGLVNPEDVEKEISSDTCLVSIMFANNEVGTLQPIKEIGKITHEKKVAFHTDAVQAVGKIPIDVKELGLDLLSISSHKINGPKGVGALYIRKGVTIDPLILGGGQENGLRSGTENVASIVGFGMACQLAKDNMIQNYEYFRNLGMELVSEVLKEIPHTKLNGHPEKRIPNNIHFTFLGLNGEDLIIKLDENKIAASTGSACSVKVQKASHVLKAMGFSHEQITGSLRLTIGITNTENEINETVQVLKKVVKELRAVSPYKEKYNF